MHIEIIGQKIVVNGEVYANLYPFRNGYCLEILAPDNTIHTEMTHSSRDYLLDYLLGMLYD